MSESVRKFCEICQIKVEEDVSNDYKLDSLPEIDPQLTENSVICDQCITQITDVQESKQSQVNHESILRKLLQQDVLLNNNFEERDGKEELGVEKIKEEFNVGLVKDEVCDLLYYCHDCGCCTDTKQKLVQHICRQHKNKDLHKHIDQCDECGYKSSSASDLKHHSLTHNNDKSLKCTHTTHPFQCDNTIEECNQCDLRHTAENPFYCDKCDYKCSLEKSLNRHKLTHSNEKPFKCSECNYACKNAVGLKIHMYQHTGQYPIQCDKCDYKGSCTSNLKLHKLTHTNEKPFKCTQCNYASRQARLLKAHMNKHTGKHLFQCDKCDYKSSSTSGFAYHKLTHSNDKPFKCTECNYACRESRGLNTHMYLHTNPIQCDKCDYKSSSARDLKYHKLTHTNVRLFKCTQCNYVSKTSKLLKAHMCKHTGKYPFQCKKCDYKCVRIEFLKKHKLSHTSGESSLNKSLKSTSSATTKVPEKSICILTNGVILEKNGSNFLSVFVKCE